MTGKKALLRFVCLALCMLLAMGTLSACGGSSDNGSGAAAAEDSQDAASDVVDSTGTVDQAYVEEQSVDISSLAGGDGIDVDLTKLSATMVYSVVNDMMVRPDEYLGKMIKMNGVMAVYFDEETGKTYYACIIMDATACCSQGIEFKTTDGHYPAEGDDVTVTGTYDLYDEDGVQYCILKDAVIE